MHVKYALLADSAHLSTDQKPTIVGVFSTVNASKFPYTLPTMTFVTEIQADEHEKGSHDFSFEMRNYDGKVLNSFNLPSIIVGKPEDKGPTYSAGIQIGIKDLVFPKPGIYEFIMLCDNKYLTSVDISVRKVNIKQIKH